MRVQSKNLIFVVVVLAVMAAMSFIVLNVNTIFRSDITNEDINNIVTTGGITVSSERGTHPGAPVTFVEFSDFECPYCGAVFPIIKQVLAKYGDQVNYIYKHLPNRKTSVQAAEAVECAKNQDKFMEMHDQLFMNLDHSLDTIYEHAANLNLNVQRFRLCMTTHAKKPLIEKDILDAQLNGVLGTPTFFINNKKMVGVRSFEAFTAIIDQELGNV